MAETAAPPRETRAPRPAPRTPFEIDDRVTLKLDHNLAYDIQAVLARHGDPANKALLAFTRTLKTRLDRILAEDED